MSVRWFPWVLAAGCTTRIEPDGSPERLARGEACAEAAIVGLVNAPDTTVEVLVGIGVYTRGAANLVIARNGPDGLAATFDDGRFDDLAQIDAVPQIGSVSIDALLDWAADRCLDDVVFSPQPYATSSLARAAALIDGADRTIDLAMYSFSDGAIRDALGRAVDRGVTVRAVLEGANADHDSPAGTWSASLEDRGIEVRWVNKIMHHKFVLVDGPRDTVAAAATGTLYNSSGNWSYSAGTKFDENTVFLKGDPKLVLAYQQEFERMWDGGRPFVWNEAIPSIGAIGITDADIAAADGSSAVFTSDNFRSYVSATYGPTFARDGSKATVVNELVALIESAQSRIRIASGHFRSRPIAEAVLAKVASDPEVDVEVYLDGQEYTSAWTFDDQREEYEACLAEATDDGDRLACDEMGMHFGYALVEAGVDVRYKTYAYRWDYSYAPQMHHKYLVVDDARVATGSYNYSFNAEYDTFENVAVYDRERYPELVDGYVGNHEAMWQASRDGTYEALLAEITDGTGDVPLVFPAMALGWAETNALKDAIRAACPAVDSAEYRDDPAGHTSCPR